MMKCIAAKLNEEKSRDIEFKMRLSDRQKRDGECKNMRKINSEETFARTRSK